MILALLIALSMQAEPQLLELGTHATARLRIDAPSRPRLTVNVGAITGLREESQGKWIADYVPPRPTYPQVALVAAVAGTELAWTAIPLWGRGVAEVHTRARASISVDIGPRSFGPVQADEHGVARVPVVVPPGTHEARHKAQRIPLPMPESLRVLVVMIEDRGVADRDQTFSIRVLAVDDAGQPLNDAPVSLRPARGKVSALEPAGPGESKATWSIPAGVSGLVAIEASLAELSSRAAVRLDGGSATAIDLTADRQSVTAGEGNEVHLQARARDAKGNASPEPLQLDAPAGFTVRAAGDAEWRVIAADFFAGRTSAELMVHPRGRALPSATVTLRLLPAAPALAAIEPERTSVRVGPGGSLKLRVTRVDRFGNPVPGAPSPSADAGKVAQVAPLSDGAWVATYVPPQQWDRGDAWVEMRWPQGEARRQLDLLPEFARLAVSPKFGAVSNFARLTSPLAAVEASLRTRALGQELAFSAEGAWYFASATDGALQARADFFAFAAQASVRLRAGARNLFWIGAGPSLTAVATRNSMQLSESTVMPGALISLGAERKYPALIPFAEARWSWHADPGISNLSGAVSALSLVLGTRFELL